MKKINEKQIVDLAFVTAGQRPNPVNISIEVDFSVVWTNFFDGSLFKKSFKGERFNEFDKYEDNKVLSF